MYFFSNSKVYLKCTFNIDIYIYFQTQIYTCGRHPKLMYLCSHSEVTESRFSKLVYIPFQTQKYARSRLSKFRLLILMYLFRTSEVYLRYTF